MGRAVCAKVLPYTTHCCRADMLVCVARASSYWTGVQCAERISMPISDWPTDLTARTKTL